ncbi:alpha/beta fold hydrolase [Planomonospora venezuelensis]|uniref:Pimeloyl-ACP methyl ester carboxylesterase n=1 Tax=Planomonospora venezuelensis TaxID=1999 RepID=A0A841D0A0_PLAVE|nr:alpha/beta hydrolase [Planomonospora venezuelensis]MBB5961954.1 pimeloyl-ACP methyl ester carboxylesterase [Planomonospora venezuelensis]GIM98979.1 lysophospholipase [Planomonospora venezuelensis]
MLPIVFVHGIRVSATMWGPVMSRLDRPSIAVDLPGHGAGRGEPFTMDAAVSAVAGAIDGAGGRAFVAGLSLGGYVGIAAAERFPGKVAGLVAMGCTALPDRYAGIYRFIASLAARNPPLADRLSSYGLRRALPGPAGEAMVAGGLSCEVMPQAVEAVAGHGQLAALAAYPGRVWLVNGARDPFRADERAFLRACRDGRLILAPGRGHLGMLAAPGVLARLVGDLCDQVDGPGAGSAARRGPGAGAGAPAGRTGGAAGDQAERPESAVATPRPR